MLLQHSSLDNGSQKKSIVRHGLLLNGGKSHTMNVLLIIPNVAVTSNYHRIVKTSFSMRAASKKKFFSRGKENCRKTEGVYYMKHGRQLSA
jgi:hypothetical protein